MKSSDYSYYQAESLLKDWRASNLALAKAVLVAGNNSDKAKRLAERIDHCRDWITLRIEPGTLLPKVFRANCCGHRLCKYCASKKSRKDRHALYCTLSEMYARGDFEKYDFYRVTLTWPNCEFGQLRESFRSANERVRDVFALLGSDRRGGFIAGTFRSIEFTIGKSDPDKFHPHMHCLIAVKAGTDPQRVDKRLRERWAFYYPEKEALNAQGKYTDHIAPFAFDMFNKENNGLGDFCKYILKLSDVYDLPADRLAEVLPYCSSGVRGLKACSYGGIFRDAYTAVVQNGFDYYDLEPFGFQETSFYERLKNDANFIQFRELRNSVDFEDVIFAEELTKPINTPTVGYKPMVVSGMKYCDHLGNTGFLSSFACVRNLRQVDRTSDYRLVYYPDEIPQYEMQFHGGDPFACPSFKLSFAVWFKDVYRNSMGRFLLDRETMKLAYDYVMSDFWRYDPYDDSYNLAYDGGVWCMPVDSWKSSFDNVMAAIDGFSRRALMDQAIDSSHYLNSSLSKLNERY